MTYHMERFIKIFIWVQLFFLFGCDSSSKTEHENKEVLSKSEKRALEELRTFYSFEEVDEWLVAKNCFANVCTIFRSQHIEVSRREMSDMALIYQLYFSSDFRQESYKNRLSPKSCKMVLDSYAAACKASEGKEKCVFLYLANKNQVECVFTRFDEGEKNTVIMDCKNWAVSEK